MIARHWPTEHLNWSGVPDVQTALVLDDEEARTVGKKRMANAVSKTNVAVAN